MKRYTDKQIDDCAAWCEQFRALPHVSVEEMKAVGAIIRQQRADFERLMDANRTLLGLLEDMRR